MTDVFTYILALAGVWTVVLPAIVAAKLRRLKLTASDACAAPRLLSSGERRDLGGDA